MYKLNINQMQEIIKRYIYHYPCGCSGLNPWLRGPQNLLLNLKETHPPKIAIWQFWTNFRNENSSFVMWKRYVCAPHREASEQPKCDD